MWTMKVIFLPFQFYLLIRRFKNLKEKDKFEIENGTVMLPRLCKFYKGTKKDKEKFFVVFWSARKIDMHYLTLCNPNGIRHFISNR